MNRVDERCVLCGFDTFDTYWPYRMTVGGIVEKELIFTIATAYVTFTVVCEKGEMIPFSDERIITGG